jgi:hypothetical protein
MPEVPGVPETKAGTIPESRYAVGLVVLAIRFALWQRRARHPLMPPTI